MGEERRVTTDLTNSVLRHLDGYLVFTRVLRERRVALIFFSELRQCAVGLDFLLVLALSGNHTQRRVGREETSSRVTPDS